jgi:hypothetical protein
MLERQPTGNEYGNQTDESLTTQPTQDQETIHFPFSISHLPSKTGVESTNFTWFFSIKNTRLKSVL